MLNWYFLWVAFLFLTFHCGLNAKEGYREFKFSITHKIISVRAVSDKSVFIFTNFSIVHFNGVRWRVLKSGIGEIKNADTDGEYIIVDVKRLDKDFVKPNFILMRFNGEVIIDEVKLEIPMTHSSNSIKFVSRGRCIIGGLFEYCFISLGDSIRYKIFPFSERVFILSHYTTNYPYPALVFNGLYSIYSLKLPHFSDLNRRDSYFVKFFDDVISGAVKPEISKLLDLDSIVSKFGNFKTVIPYSRGYILNFERGGLGFVRENQPFVFEFIRAVSGISFVDVKNEYITEVVSAGGDVFYAVLKTGEILKIEISGGDIVAKILNLNVKAFHILCSDKNLFVIGVNEILSVPLSEIDKFSISSENKFGGNFIFNINHLHFGSSYGIGASDVNGDGVEDIFIVDLDAPDYLYDGRYIKSPERKNISIESGISGRSWEKNKIGINVSVCTGDINNDGYEDFVVSYIQGSNCVYFNRRGYFRDVTKELGLDVDMRRSEHVSISDVNCDGWVDIFMTSFEGSNRLFISDAGNMFYDRTLESALLSDGRTVCAVFGDINGDGYPDLYIGNWTGGNKMYLNRGDGTFVDFTLESGTGGDLLMKTNSAIFTDFDNDGDLDLFLGNRGKGNKLFLNDGSGRFKDITVESGLFEPQIFTYGCTAGDFDNDGWIDIFIVYLGGIKLYRNIGLRNGIPIFEDVTEDYIRILERGMIDGYNTCCVSSDFDGDGDLDIFVSQNNGTSFYLENLTCDVSKIKNFIKVGVKGVRSNSDGIDSKISLFRNGELIGTRYVVSGSGYASSESKVIHFGLGDVLGGDEFEIEVEFPLVDGERVIKRVKVKPGQFVQVYEFDGLKAIAFDIVKFFKREINGFEFKIEIFKIAFLIILVLLYFYLYLNRAFESVMKITNRGRILRLIFLPVYSYVILRILISISFEISFQPYYWISGERIYLFNDVIPFAFSVLVLFILHFNFKRRLKIASLRGGLYSELIARIEEFGHSAQKSSILTRISLLIKNFDSADLEFERRLIELLNEYKEIVQPELESISDISEILSLDFDRGVVEKLNSEISNLLKKGLGNNLSREKILIPSLILRLYEQINKLREIVFSNFITQVESSISDVLKVLKCDFIKFKSNGENAVIFGRDDFTEVISIILKNSIDSVSGVESPEIKVEVLNFDGYVEIHIVDNGLGVNSGSIDRIISGGFSTKPYGHGFGLSYVKMCVRKYGGEMKILPVERGFYIVLKLRKAVVKN